MESDNLTCSIAQASLPLEFWDGVYSSTVYLISMSLTPVLHGKFSFGVSCFIISSTIPCSRYLIIPIIHSPDLTINTKCSSGPFHVFSLDTMRDITALIQLEDWIFPGISALMETLFHVNPFNLQRSIQNQLQSVGITGYKPESCCEARTDALLKNKTWTLMSLLSDKKIVECESVHERLKRIQMVL